MKALLLISSYFILLLSCSDKTVDPGPAPDYEPISMPAGGDQVITASNIFGIDLFKKIAFTEPDSMNLFISPTSISLALAMTRDGANGATLDSMTYALRMEGLSDDEINASYRDLISGLTSVDPEVQLNIANSIWYRQDFQIETPFLATNADYYNAEVRSLDFNSPDAKEIINSWVEDQTNHKIRNLISEINPVDIMFLINAIYFKGSWKIKFDKDATRAQNFYLIDGSSKEVAMMHLTDTILYQSNDLFQAIQLKYGSGNYAMVIILPREGKKCGNIINPLSPSQWNSWMQGFVSQKVVVTLPSFKFGYDIKLNDVLSDMGMGISFDRYNADFTRINHLGGLYINYVKHKAFVEVNEEGTEAAAATVVVVANRVSAQPDETIYFTANKPFLFAIIERSTKTIVFMGRLSDPSVY